MLFLFLLIVPGLTTPVSAAEPALPAFGEGAVEVRVYTDYFCGPCGAEEQEVMAAIAELVAKNRIRVIFIDTPVLPETVLYAEYFLAAVNAKREFGQAVTARAALFEAAGLEIRGKGELEGFLAKKGLEIRPFDTDRVSRRSVNISRKTGSTQRPPLSSWVPRESKSWATRSRSSLRSAVFGNREVARRFSAVLRRASIARGGYSDLHRVFPVVVHKGNR